LYETIRIPRTARILWSAREMGRLYHAKGVERQVRNQLWDGRTQEQFYDALQWLYGWSLDNCMKH
jgi:salicylate hydroxylase